MEGVFSGIVVIWAMFLPVVDDSRSDAAPDESLTAFAGKFHFSYGLGGETLSIDPRGSFSWEHWNDYGGTFRAHGRAKVVDGHLLLRTTGVIHRIILRSKPRELIPIYWGERLYLVPKGEAKGFCNRVNMYGSGVFGPSCNYFTREGDQKKGVSGQPAVPDEWTAMLLPEPITGKVVAVVPPRRAKVDLGARSAVWNGMLLWVNCEGAPIAEVVEVHADHCFIESTNPDGLYRIGTTVSSKEP
jgi:hypothetical protein